MAINWIFWKKFLFSSGVIGLSVTPVVLINKYGSSSLDEGISPYKESLAYLQGKYASQFGIPELTKQVLGMPGMKDGLDSVVSGDLALLTFQESPLFRESHGKAIAEVDSSYSGSHKNRKFFDSHGGSREAMRRRELTSKAQEVFKKEILDFGLGHFTINKDRAPYLSHRAHIGQSTIEDNKNWSTIGFYERNEVKHLSDPNFSRHKYELINFAHKKWFEEVKPFFVWMSLWKYKDKATTKELAKIWDSTKIGKEITQASYGFPYFDEKTTLKKFKDFFKNVVSKYEKNQRIYIPRGYTEDSAVSIMVEGKNMYSNLFTKFAAAANHKKNLGKDNKTYINQREKNEGTDSYKQPFELFLFNGNESNGKATVKISGDIFKEQTHKSKKSVADLVEIKDTPWVFIRNQAGIHAMALDAENNKDNKDEFEFFKYRFLQAIYKNQLNLSGVLDLKADSILKPFKDWFTNNFDRMLLAYLYDDNGNKGEAFFGHQLPDFIRDFKEVFKASEELEQIKGGYLSRLKLRETLLTTYAQYGWEIDDKNKFKHASPKDGLVGMSPWKLNTDDENKHHLFEDLEKIYGEQKENPSKKYAEKLKGYQNKVDSFVDKLQLKLDPDASNQYSDRVFSDNYYVNRINDGFLDKSQLFNEFLFKYLIRSGYLQRTELAKNDKAFVDEDLRVTVPTDYKQDKEEDQFLKKMEGTEALKSVLGALDKQIKANYYSRILLSKESSNPWEAAKYGGLLLKNQSGKVRENLQKVAESAFEDAIAFNLDNSREKYYKFLSTLAYLIANNFENLLKYLSSHLGHKKDSYIVFSNYDLSRKELKLDENSLNNPFLDREKYETRDYKKDVKNIHKYFSSVNFSDSKNKVDQGFLYQGFYTGSNSEALNIPRAYAKDFTSSGLYKYGGSAEEMNKWILGITSNDEFKSVVDDLARAVEKESDKTWVSNLKLDTIYITQGGTKTLKTLTLQEKKNLLSAYLNSVEVSINNESIAKDKYKDVFLTDPDNGFNSTGSPHQKKNDSKNEKLKTDQFKKLEEIKSKENSTEKAYKLFQINAKDVEDFEKFKKYVNDNLSQDVFWAWVINLANLEEVQELSLNDLSDKAQRVKTYDKRWYEQGNSRFVER